MNAELSYIHSLILKVRESSDTVHFAADPMKKLEAKIATYVESAIAHATSSGDASLIRGLESWVN